MYQTMTTQRKHCVTRQQTSQKDNVALLTIRQSTLTINNVEVVILEIILIILTMCAKNLIFVSCFLQFSKHFDSECACETSGFPKISKQPLKMLDKNTSVIYTSTFKYKKPKFSISPNMYMKWYQISQISLLFLYLTYILVFKLILSTE